MTPPNIDVSVYWTTRSRYYQSSPSKDYYPQVNLTCRTDKPVSVAVEDVVTIAQSSTPSAIGCYDLVSQSSWCISSVTWCRPGWLLCGLGTPRILRSCLRERSLWWMMMSRNILCEKSLTTCWKPRLLSGLHQGTCDSLSRRQLCEYVIDRILDRKGPVHIKRYLIKWKGYPDIFIEKRSETSRWRTVGMSQTDLSAVRFATCHSELLGTKIHCTKVHNKKEKQQKGKTTSIWWTFSGQNRPSEKTNETTESTTKYMVWRQRDRQRIQIQIPRIHFCRGRSTRIRHPVTHSTSHVKMWSTQTNLWLTSPG